MQWKILSRLSSMKISAVILVLGLSTFFSNNAATADDVFHQHGDLFKQHQDLMYVALVEGNTDRVEKLLKTPYVAANDKIRGEPLLSIAIRNDHPDIVQLLLKNGADVTAETDSGHNVLNSWALQPSIPMLEFLLQRVEAKFSADKQGFKRFINNRTDASNISRTPLCAAMLYSESADFTDDGVLQIAKLLVDAGADVNAVDASGHAPLDYAKCYRTFGQKLDRPKTSAYLEQHGAVCAQKPNH